MCIRDSPEAVLEGPISKEEVPEENIIYIDDDGEPSPLTKLKNQVDRMLGPLPIDNTLTKTGTLPDLSQGLSKPTRTGQQPYQGRSSIMSKKLQERRKVGKPLMLDMQAVAKMHMGPRNMHRSQELARLASAVVPLEWLNIREDAKGNIPRPETPAPKINKIQPIGITMTDDQEETLRHSGRLVAW